MLNLNSLQQSLASLNKAIARTLENKNDEELRDAVIQRFEYTYELCWKMLKRRLEIDHPNPPDVDQMSYNQLIREGAERGLLEHPEKWFFYRDQRNITSHAYDQKKAQQVYQTALEFAQDARILLSHLERHND